MILTKTSQGKKVPPKIKANNRGTRDVDPFDVIMLESEISDAYAISGVDEVRRLRR